MKKGQFYILAAIILTGMLISSLVLSGIRSPTKYADIPKSYMDEAYYVINLAILNFPQNVSQYVYDYTDNWLEFTNHKYLVVPVLRYNNKIYVKNYLDETISVSYPSVGELDLQPDSEIVLDFTDNNLLINYDYEDYPINLSLDTHFKALFVAIEDGRKRIIIK